VSSDDRSGEISNLFLNSNFIKENNGTIINGLFGLQYSLSKHVGITGEIGIGYTNEKTEGLTEDKLSTTFIGLTTTGVGVVIYVN